MFNPLIYDLKPHYSAMSKSAVKISSDLLSNPLCEQEPSFLEMVTAFDTAMKRMDSFNQEKVNQIQKTVIEPLKKCIPGQEHF
ncbi:hypothetical protein DV515_00015922 [Chloebia gouldiae]|uniref:BAR domain-containing protein n=1 Tax=Chloebia gouldiae TaxID=44316 RepID=A0A3L8RVD4_CHLGU|nr:hypothetical protein DV515_00015922 [Chloebia gouldiae]